MKRPIPGNDVAVVIPVAGRPVLVREAIRSVLGGSLLPAELLVVVNSQGDLREADSEAVREEFRIQQERIPGDTHLRLLHATSPGPAAARNEGIGATERTWIAFLDSDDLWKPEKLELQMEYLRKRPHLSGCQTLEEWRKNGVLLEQPARLRPGIGRFYGAAMENCLISPSSVAIKRDLLLSLGGFKEAYPVCEDYELWLRYLPGNTMGLLDLPLTIKRTGDWKQLSRETHSMDRYRIQAILEQARENKIPPDQWERAGGICLEKLRILEQGATRRGNPRLYEGLRQNIAERFPSLAISSALPDHKPLPYPDSG